MIEWFVGYTDALELVVALLNNYKQFVCLIDGDSIKRLQYKRHWTWCRINSVTWLNAHTGNYCIGYFLRKREVFVSSYCIAAPSFKIYSLNLSNVVGHQRVLPTGFKNSFVDKSRKILLIKKLCNEIKKNLFVYFKTIYNCFALTQLSDQFYWRCMEKKSIILKPFEIIYYLIFWLVHSPWNIMGRVYFQKDIKNIIVGDN